MTDTPTPDPDTTLARLLALGVPYHLAAEAIASTALDRDERARTQSLAAWAESDEPTVDPDAEIVRGPDAGALPRWLHDDPDGYRIVDRD